MPEFRYFGSIIEAALELGHDVELWHDYSQPREGIKGSQFPLIEKAPMLVGGPPKSLAYEGKTALNQMLAERSVDCVVASRGPVWYLNDDCLNSLAIPWIGIQETLDYAAFGLDCFTSATLECVFSQYWVDLISTTYSEPGGYPAMRENLGRISRVTGATQADSFGSIDSAEVREHWNIPDDVPVVLYLPSSRGANLFSSVLLKSSRLAKAKLILAAGQWRNLSYLRHDFSDRALVRSVRRFCDNNNAFMLVKTREKQPLPDYLREAADRLVMDEGEYPATILRALSVSDLCVSAYLSTSINDAAAAGVPFLGIYRDAKAWPYSHRRADMIKKPAETFFLTGDGDYFNCPGFAYPIPIVNAINRLANWRISDFPLRQEALREFTAKYVGSLDGRNGHRVLNNIEDLLANGGRVENMKSQLIDGVGELFEG